MSSQDSESVGAAPNDSLTTAFSFMGLSRALNVCNDKQTKHAATAKAHALTSNINFPFISFPAYFQAGRDFFQKSLWSACQCSNVTSP
jgi:hypothetical protein